MPTAPTSDNVNRCFVRNGSGQRPANRRNHDSGMLNQAHQLFDIELASVHFQIRLWFFTHQPLFPVLQISNANHAEMFPQDSRCAQEVIGVRVSGVATPFRTNRCRTDNGDRLLVRKLRRAKGWQIKRCWRYAELASHRIKYRTAPQIIRSVKYSLRLSWRWRRIKLCRTAKLIFTLRSERGVTSDNFHRQIFVKLRPCRLNECPSRQLFDESALVNGISHSQHAIDVNRRIQHVTSLIAASRGKRRKQLSAVWRLLLMILTLPRSCAATRANSPCQRFTFAAVGLSRTV
ncbi:Uncharacterised protein [Escherichia coli]|nr:hypothetical protein JRT83AECX_JRT83AEC_04911 [Escherichia coli]SQL98169.1 Uncharacterised protein [Escherichia coli]